MRLTFIAIFLVLSQFIVVREINRIEAKLDNASECRAPIVEDAGRRIMVTHGGCTTDTDCMLKFGGSGGPEPIGSDL